MGREKAYLFLLDLFHLDNSYWPIATQYSLPGMDKIYFMTFIIIILFKKGALT